MLKIIGASDSTIRVGMFDRTFVTVNLRSKKNTLPFAARLHRPSSWISGSSNRAGSRTMIGTVARNDLRLSRIHPCDLERSLVRLCARCGEEKFTETFGKYLQENL